jgi:RsiW-degrading membrane proteinase PrsW (M82 family)
MSNNADKQLFGKFQRAHGENAYGYSLFAALAYGWFGAHDYGFWWIPIWFGVGIGIALLSGIVLLPFFWETARPYPKPWHLIASPVTFTRPLWMSIAAWFAYDNVHRWTGML